MIKCKGNTLFQYILVIALIGLILTPVLFTHGQYIIDALTNQTTTFENINTQMSENKSARVSSSATTSPVMSSQDIAGFNVDLHEDGSATFNVNGQNVSLSPQIINLHNVVEETTGSAALNSLVQEIAYMIEVHQSDYPQGDVPVKIAYGNGVRWNTGTTYEGSAEVNATTIKVGNDFVIIQNDQSCTGSCSQMGLYRIEGTLIPPNHFDSRATCDTVSGANEDLEGEYQITEGNFTVTNGNYRGFNWDLTFNNTNYWFDI